ncbi:MAG: hypothetical protein QOC81_478 [Thermoanaerobaculia bacterium]|jgi:hypothetical protein|nr:hypothetical protein [Thermoanaerobaculia bacterium]
MKIVKAEFDAEKQILKLSEPLDGFDDHEHVTVIVHHIDPDRPWLEFRGALAGEEGERFANAVEEMFPIEK